MLQRPVFTLFSPFFRMVPFSRVVLILVLGACAGPSATIDGAINLRTPSGADSGTTWQGDRSAATERAELVARTAMEWRQIWSTVGMPAPQPLPDDYMAVAIFLGTRTTGGYAVILGPAIKRDGGISIPYHEDVPGPNDPVASSPASPFGIRLVPAVSSSVAFHLAP
ncbi:MAG: protease complex subunit PrcB family protein [Rhodospirillaceae bacterium]